MRKNHDNLPLVSVVIPAYNAERFITSSIESITTQTYKSLEIIIINDASTDGTLRIIKDCAQKDPRVVVYDNKKNLGIGATRSKGIELSTGKYICWQDADDISLPERIHSQVSYLEAHPRVGVVGGYMQFFDENGDGQVRRYKEHDADLRRTIFRYNPVAQPASLVRSECYGNVGVYNPELKVNEDLDMLFRIGEKYEFANVQEVVLRYRQSLTSLTRSNLKSMEIVAINLRRKYVKSSAYSYSTFDIIFNCLQLISSWMMPTAFRIRLFQIIRGDR